MIYELVNLTRMQEDLAVVEEELSKGKLSMEHLVLFPSYTALISQVQSV